MTVSDPLLEAAKLLCNGNSPFDQILFCRTSKVLSFRYHSGRYVNIWLDSEVATEGDHFCETNGGAATASEVLYDYHGDEQQ